jgi:hypothetical protein
MHAVEVAVAKRAMKNVLGQPEMPEDIQKVPTCFALVEQDRLMMDLLMHTAVQDNLGEPQ